jgi:hypothetical protein
VYFGEPSLVELAPIELLSLLMLLAHPARPSSAATATIAGSDFM